MLNTNSKPKRYTVKFDLFNGKGDWQGRSTTVTSTSADSAEKYIKEVWSSVGIRNVMVQEQAK